MLVVPDSLSAAILASLSSSSSTYNILYNAKVHLFQNDYTPTRDTVLADLTEATFTNYVASASVTWLTVLDAVLGPYLLSSLLAAFTTGAGPVTTPNTIYGWYLTDSTGATLLGAERFAASVIMNAPDQVIPILPTFGAVSQG